MVFFPLDPGRGQMVLAEVILLFDVVIGRAFFERLRDKVHRLFAWFWCAPTATNTTITILDLTVRDAILIIIL
jgi:hypothetical protein